MNIDELHILNIQHNLAQKKYILKCVKNTWLDMS